MTASKSSLRLAGALLGALAIGLGAASAHADQSGISDEARQHFHVGVDLLDDPEGPRYEEAYRAFKAAYAASPSPKILGNLGLCAMKLERDGEAIAAYSRYLKEVDDIDKGERAQIERDLQVLKTGVVPVELSVEPAGATVTDERIPTQGASIRNRYGPAQGAIEIGLRAGNHRITVQREGYEPQSWELEAVAGERVEKAVRLKPAAGAARPAPERPAQRPGPTPVPEPEGERPVPPGVIVGLVVTGALAVAGGVTGGLALGKQSEYSEYENDDSLSPKERATAEDIADTGTTLNIVTDVLFGSALVAAGVTTYLFVTRPAVREDERKDKAERARLRLLPVAGPRGAGALLRASF
ncbi:MAG: hypothetical protein HY744_19250 [Deltaproteobacteria bacterium]|nr:hypothetical protein [Deltaproteobacteria bacterium]